MHTRKYTNKNMKIDFSLGAEEQYLALLQNILQYGVFKGDRTGVGTQDLFGYQMQMDLSKGFPLLTTKKMFTRGIIEELLWIMRGDTNVKSLQAKGVKIWDEWSTAEQCAKFGRQEGDLGPVYGKQWRDFGGTTDTKGVDQLADVLHALRTNPFSRRIIISAWDPQTAGQVALPPCHSFVQFSVRPGAVNERPLLDCQLYQRSADSFLGVPFNFSSYALLTHILANLAGMLPGTFVHSFGSVHIYSNHRDQVQEQLTRTPFPLPTLNISMGGSSPTSTIDDFLASCKGAEDFAFVGYQSHAAIKADVAI